MFVFPPLTPTTPGCRSLALKSPPTDEIRLYSLVLCQNILLEFTRLFYNGHATMSNFWPKDNNFFYKSKPDRLQKEPTLSLVQY